MLRILDIRPQLPGYVAFDNILLLFISVFILMPPLELCLGHSVFGLAMHL